MQHSTIEAAARLHAYDTIDFYSRHVPGFQNARVSQLAPYMGTRWSRTIVPDYTLSRDDIVGERKFDDVVHVLTTLYRYDDEAQSGGRTRQLVNLREREEGHHFDMPLGQFLPQGVEGLLAAGTLHRGVTERPACAGAGSPRSPAALPEWRRLGPWPKTSRRATLTSARCSAPWLRPATTWASRRAWRTWASLKARSAGKPGASDQMQVG